jgi:hypothetical protein
MRLTKILLLTIAIFFASFSKAQMPDSKLSAVYTPEEINHFKQAMPDVIKFNNFYVNNAAYITEAPKGKAIKTIELHKINPKTGEILSDAIQMIDLIDFNPYLFNCKSQFDKNTYYSIGNTGKILVMRSTKEIQRRFSQSNLNAKK